MAALEHMGWVILADHVEGLFKVMQDYFARLFKACHLHLHYVSDALFIVLDIFDALVVLDHSRDTQVQTAKDNSLLDVLDKCQNICINLKRACVNDVPVYEAIANALSGIAQDLVVQLGRALVYLASFGDVVDDFLVEDIHASHFLIHLWKVLYVLSCILYHRRS